MSTAVASRSPGIADPRALKRSLARAERLRKVRAASLTLPLLIFLLVTLLVPIAALLKRAIENPEVSNAIPRTVAALDGWDRKAVPAPEAFAALVADLG